MRNRVVTALALLATAASAAAELPEPAMNTGATVVEVQGTHVTAEARAAALGHSVDAIVVARLVVEPGKAAAVVTYERWSKDGKEQSDRGDARLGEAWEKAIRSALDAAEKGATPQARERPGPPPKDLLDRLASRLGTSGSRVVGDEVVSWSLGASDTESDGKTSRARTALVALSPRPAKGPASPSTGAGAAPGDPVTPGDGGASGGGSGPSVAPSGAGTGPIHVRSDGTADSDVGCRHHALGEFEFAPPAPPARGGPPAPPPSGRTPPDR